MLPEKKKEPLGSGDRKGFEVRVIGGGSSSPQAPKLIPDVEEGIRIESSEPRPRPRSPELEGPVHRLDVEQDGDRLEVKTTSDVDASDPENLPPSRRGRSRYKLDKWTLWMGIGCCFTAVFVVVGLMFRTSDAEPDQLGLNKDLPLESLSPAEVEKNFFVTHANELAAASEEILRKYVAAESAEDVLPLVRDAGRVKSILTAKWQPWETKPPFSANEDFLSSLYTEGTRPFLILSGVRGDFAPFEVVFVREGGEMFLDWEATWGIGELQISDLKNGKPAENGEVRAVVSPADFFTRDFPEGKFKSYKLADVSGQNFVWAYVAVDSPAAERLSIEFNESSFLMEENEELQATLKLSGPKGEVSNQYLVTEMLHKGWVSP